MNRRTAAVSIFVLAILPLVGFFGGSEPGLLGSTQQEELEQISSSLLLATRGEARLASQVDAMERTPVVTDETGASIELSFRTATGEPVGGIQAVLIKVPQTGTRRTWRANWAGVVPKSVKHVRSEVDGFARWSNLEPGRYRWGVPPGRHSIDVEPGFEVPRIERTKAGIEYRQGVPQQLSGEFTLGDGESRRFDVPVHSAELRGFVQAMPGHLNANVRISLMHRTHEAIGEQGGAVLLRVDRYQVLEGGGSFVMHHVPGGEKLFRVEWQSSAARKWQVMRVIQMESGATRDLGSLAPEGEDLKIKFSSERPAEVRVRRIAPMPGDWTYTDGMVGTEEVTFSGLPRGEYEVTSGAAASPVRWNVPGDGPELTLRSARARAFDVEVTAPRDLRRIEVQLILQSGQVVTVDDCLRPEGSMWAVRRSIRHSGKPVAVVAKCLDRSLQKVWVGFGTIPAGSQQLRIRMDRGAMVEGSVVNSTEETRLTAGPAGSGVWPWPIVVSNSQFRLGPVPSDTVLDVRDFSARPRVSRLTTPGAGQSSRVEIMMR